GAGLRRVGPGADRGRGGGGLGAGGRRPPVRAEPGRRVRDAVAGAAACHLRGAIMFQMSIRRTLSVARKELLHLLRDPTALFFALLIPLLQTFLLGYAIDTNVRHIRTAVVDHARTQESRELLQSFVNSDDFDIVAEEADEAALHRAIVSGKARVGVLIPAD